MTKMIITCPTSYQITEDKWLKSYESMSFKPEDQVKDILQWAMDKKFDLGAAIITLIEDKQDERICSNIQNKPANIA